MYGRVERTTRCLTLFFSPPFRYFEGDDGNLGLVCEEAVLQWAAEPPPKAAPDVRLAASAFVEWLKHAPCEEERDEDDYGDS